MRLGQTIRFRFILLILLLVAAQSYGMLVTPGHCPAAGQMSISADTPMLTDCPDAGMDPAHSDCIQHLCNVGAVLLNNASVRPALPALTAQLALTDTSTPLCFTQIIYRPPRA